MPRKPYWSSAWAVSSNRSDCLFDRFYRTNQSRSSQTGGYELGLSIRQKNRAGPQGKVKAKQLDARTLAIVASFPC